MGLLRIEISTLIGSSLDLAVLAAVAIASTSEIIALTNLAS